MIQWKWKILAIPRAKHKIMQRTPVLKTKLETSSRSFPSVVSVFRVGFRACLWTRNFHHDLIRHLLPHILYAVTDSNGVEFSHIRCISNPRDNSKFFCRTEMGKKVRLLLTIVHIYLKSIRSAAVLSPKPQSYLLKFRDLNSSASVIMSSDTAAQQFYSWIGCTGGS